MTGRAHCQRQVAYCIATEASVIFIFQTVCISFSRQGLSFKGVADTRRMGVSNVVYWLKGIELVISKWIVFYPKCTTLRQTNQMTEYYYGLVGQLPGPVLFSLPGNVLSIYIS